MNIRTLRSFAKLRSITVEYADGKIEVLDLEMDRCVLTLENGVNICSNAGWDVPSNLSSNGQRRLSLKAWDNCMDYDSFESETKYP